MAGYLLVLFQPEFMNNVLGVQPAFTAVSNFQDSDATRVKKRQQRSPLPLASNAFSFTRDHYAKKCTAFLH